MRKIVRSSWIGPASGLLLLLGACGGESDPAGDPDATFGVDPGAAMDTTPAGTPAPPEEATVDAAENAGGG